MATLIRFIEIYCRDHHENASRSPVAARGHDIERMHGGPVEVCADCRKLMLHAMVKRTACPMNPKPTCKHCPDHCYHPTYRSRIRQVMKHSGRKLVLHGRIDLLWHLLF
ncbi:MAG: hypothetical protein CMJ18_23605 [Phycisphaeraceae bacterium]|nr:hypothetical protein [Phycisphaeraceae bacterium]